MTSIPLFNFLTFRLLIPPSLRSSMSPSASLQSPYPLSVCLHNSSTLFHKICHQEYNISFLQFPPGGMYCISPGAYVTKWSRWGGPGEQLFCFIILEIPVPHIPKTHNFSSLCLIFLGYRSSPSFGHSRSLTSSSLLSIIPFLSVLRFTQSFNSLHTPIGPFIWDEKK